MAYSPTSQLIREGALPLALVICVALSGTVFGHRGWFHCEFFSAGRADSHINSYLANVSTGDRAVFGPVINAPFIRKERCSANYAHGFVTGRKTVDEFRSGTRGTWNDICHGNDVTFSGRDELVIAGVNPDGGKKKEIIWSIVRSVFIDMVDCFCASKIPSEYCLGNNDVFKYAISLISPRVVSARYFDVSLCFSSTTVPVPVALAPVFFVGSSDVPRIAACYATETTYTVATSEALGFEFNSALFAYDGYHCGLLSRSYWRAA